MARLRKISDGKPGDTGVIIRYIPMRKREGYVPPEDEKSSKKKGGRKKGSSKKKGGKKK